MKPKKAQILEQELAYFLAKTPEELHKIDKNQAFDDFFDKIEGMSVAVAPGDGCKAFCRSCPILDPASGSRMMHFDRKNPRVIFGDCRDETIKVTDRSHGNLSGTRTIHIHPDILMDFRDLPFADESFHLIAFDPPHLVRAGKKSWLAAKYGKLSDSWQDDLRKGFAECWRVLALNGTLVFKWNEDQIPLREILDLVPQKPVFGNTSGRKNKTHWLCFFKHGEKKSS